MKKSKKPFLLLFTAGIFVLIFILAAWWNNNKKNNSSNQTSNSVQQERKNYLHKLEQLPNWNLVSEPEKENLKKEINDCQPAQMNNVLEQAKKLIKKKQGKPIPPNNPSPLPSPNNNKYAAITASGQEKEYKFNPYLPISSVGTDYSKLSETNNNSLLPGSALLTDTLDGSGGGSSSLDSRGITHIIHAAPWPRDLFKNDEDFINCVVKSVQNSIILADRNNFEKLAIPLVGGGIYLGSCDLQKLAEGIMKGAINQLAECQKLQKIIFLDWHDNNTPHKNRQVFLSAFSKLQNEGWFGNHRGDSAVELAKNPAKTMIF